MTRAIRTDTTAVTARRDFALGALSAAGHEICDDVALDLLDQLNRDEFDFETYKRLVVDHHQEQ